MSPRACMRPAWSALRQISLGHIPIACFGRNSGCRGRRRSVPATPRIGRALRLLFHLPLLRSAQRHIVDARWIICAKPLCPAPRMIDRLSHRTGGGLILLEFLRINSRLFQGNPIILKQVAQRHDLQFQRLHFGISLHKGLVILRLQILQHLRGCRI